MPGAHRIFKLGPKTYTVSTAVLGGQLVQFDSSNVGQIKPAGAGTNRYACLGSACADANPGGSDPTNPINLGGWARPEVAVAYGPEEVDLVYASSANPGDPLKCAANGAVTKATVGTDSPDLIVAVCTAQAAVSSGATAPAKLLV